MTNLKNELPFAVHLVSGGDARVRTGSQVISLVGASSGSFQVTNATRFRLRLGSWTTGGMMLLVGYSSPVTLANASWWSDDSSEIADDVPEGTTVYFATVNPEDLTPVPGGANDAVHVSCYG